jgi:hypothetical protein
MTRFSTLASVAVFTLVLATGTAGALEPIGGLNDSIMSGGSGGSGGSSSSPGEPFGSPGQSALQDAIITTPQESLNDAILDGQNTIPINPIVLGGDKGKGTRIDIRKGELVLAFACKVGAEDILTLRNAGATVPAGTKVRWDVASYGDHGVVRLKSDLATGDAVRVATHADLVAGAPCIARAI